MRLTWPSTAVCCCLPLVRGEDPKQGCVQQKSFLSCASMCRPVLQVNPKTGAMEYRGAVAQRCWALASVTHGGQIICDPPTLEGIHGQLADLRKCCTSPLQSTSPRYAEHHGLPSDMPACLCPSMHGSGICCHGQLTLASWRSMPASHCMQYYCAYCTAGAAAAAAADVMLC